METNKKQDNEEALFAKIDQSLKDRLVIYTTESKLSGKKETDSIRKLLEVSLDTYMREHPIAIKHE